MLGVLGALGGWFNAASIRADVVSAPSSGQVLAQDDFDTHALLRLEDRAVVA